MVDHRTANLERRLDRIEDKHEGVLGCLREKGEKLGQCDNRLRRLDVLLEVSEEAVDTLRQLERSEAASCENCSLRQCADSRDLDWHARCYRVEDLNSCVEILLRKRLRENLGELAGEDEGASLQERDVYEGGRCQRLQDASREDYAHRKPSSTS